MNFAIPKNIKELKQHLKDPVYKNSFFLVLSRVFNVACGFFFWMLQVLSEEEVFIGSKMSCAPCGRVSGDQHSIPSKSMHLNRKKRQM